MRLAVSNLAWSTADDERAIALLASLNVQGVEVAPTRIADWADLDRRRVRDYAARLAAAGLAVSSLQAIFHNQPGAQLLGGAPEFGIMLDHFRKVADLAAELGAEVAVFGAPKNRSRGSTPAQEAQAIAVDRFQHVADVVGGSGLVIGIEPVPPFYGNDFLTTAEQVISVVKRVACPAIRLHLDTGCALLGGEDIAESIALGRDHLAHFHAAEPQLAGFDAPQSNHSAAANELRATGYDRWIAIEMREQKNNALAQVEQAICFVKKTYESPSGGTQPCGRIV